MKRRGAGSLDPAGAAPRKRRRRVESVLLIIGCVLLADALVGERGLVAMMRAREMYQSQKQRLDDVHAQHDQLEEQLRRLRDDPQTLEDEARRIGLIKPGERVFIIKDVPQSSQSK
jgi:cell division protein FtsB